MNTDNLMNEQKDTLRAFIREELEDTKKRLLSLKPNLREEDFNYLNEELDARSQTLDSLTDDEQSHLLILRRDIGLLRENMDSLAVKQSWWSRLPLYGRVLVIIVPVALYLCALATIQWWNRAQIYDYPATQTALATQTVLASQAAPNSQTALPGPAASLTPTPLQAP